MKFKFGSDTNFQLAKEAVGWRYPDNLVVFSPKSRTIEFLGERPDYQLIRRLQDCGGVEE